MSNLLVRDGHLTRNNSSGRLLRVPTFPFSPALSPAGYGKGAQWRSPDYYPEEFPGPYGYSAAYAGLSSAMSGASWKASSSQRAYALWKEEHYTGSTRTVAEALRVCRLFNTARFAGFLLNITINVELSETASGAGSRLIGISTLTSATPGAADPVISNPAIGTHTVSNIRLSNYLRLSWWISNDTPPTLAWTYENGFPRVAINIKSWSFTITGF